MWMGARQVQLDVLDAASGLECSVRLPADATLQQMLRHPDVRRISTFSAELARLRCVEPEEMQLRLIILFPRGRGRLTMDHPAVRFWPDDLRGPKEMYRRLTLRLSLPDGREVPVACRGYHTPADVIGSLIRSELLPIPDVSAYELQPWPGTCWDQIGRARMPEFLCDAAISDGQHMRIVAVDDGDDMRPHAVLYGCPTAAIPQREELLHCRVEETAYE